MRRSASLLLLPALLLVGFLLLSFSAVPSSAQGCYGLGAQTVWSFNYVYTMGCNTEETAWALGLGVSCPQVNANGTNGGFMVVNLTLVMLSSSTPVYSSNGTVNFAFQVCALLPGSTRSVGTWLQPQQGLQWQSTALTLVPVVTSIESALSLSFDNWYYPYSAPNGPNGAWTGAKGLAYYFDAYGLTYQLAQSWQGVTILNLFTSSGDVGNWIVPEGGIQLMEEIGAGPFGVVIEQSWSIAASAAPFVGCSNYPANYPMQTWLFQYAYTAVCTARYNFSGCSLGGSYSVNLTLYIQTPSTPLYDAGINSPYTICQLLPGSTRTATLNPTGSNPTTTTTSVSLANTTVDSVQFNSNNWFYPLSAANNATGPVDTALGLVWYFDNYGVNLQPSTPWSVNGVSFPFINFCTGNADVAGVGSELMEEIAAGYGQLGVISSASAWSLSVSNTQAQYTGCPSSISAFSTQVVHLFTFNIVYNALCTSQAALPGCLNGTPAVGYDQGYYVLNLTLSMLTAPAPSINTAQTLNAGYQICSLLPGSQRTTYTSLTGGAPVYQSVPITLLPNPTIQSGGPFTWDNLFYPNSYAFGAGSGTNSQNDPNAYGAEFWFDNFGVVYQVPTPYSSTNSTLLNLCSGNPTTGSPHPDTLAEEYPGGILGVVSGFSISSSSQRFAIASSYYFAYSATGPVTVNPASGAVTTAWAISISGIVTAVALSSTPGVYQILTMTGTRSVTNFQQTVSSGISLVGQQMAGGNNNLLYLNSSMFPYGMDGSGWGYSVNGSYALLPSASSTGNTLTAGSNIQLISGVLEVSSAGQSTAYSSPTVSFSPYVGGSPQTASLPSSGTIATSSGGSGSSLSKGAIAGVVIGCSIGVGLLCALCVFLAMGGVAAGSKKGDSSSTPIDAGKYRNTTEPSESDVEIQ